MPRALLGIGSNLGNRELNVLRAVAALSRFGPLRLSPLYATDAQGIGPAPGFLNAAAAFETDLGPAELLERSLAIEAGLGRRRTAADGSRTIDIDILAYDTLVVDRPGLRLPHPRMHERAFVLVPLADVAAEFRHPGLGRTVAELLATADRSGVHRWDGS